MANFIRWNIARFWQVVCVINESSLAFSLLVWQTGKQANRQTGKQRLVVITKQARRGAVMILYGLKNCDSCKKALAQLRAAGREVAYVDIRTEPLDATQLADLLVHHGADILLNRKSTSWRNLDETARSLPPQTLLAQHPTLIKRPVIFTETGSFVGWSREVKTACGL